MLKIAVFAPMASARVMTAMTVNVGAFVSRRNASCKSFNIGEILASTRPSHPVITELAEMGVADHVRA